jgi:hypothetical protein
MRAFLKVEPTQTSIKRAFKEYPERATDKIKTDPKHRITVMQQAYKIDIQRGLDKFLEKTAELALMQTIQERHGIDINITTSNPNSNSLTIEAITYLLNTTKEFTP